MKGLLFQQHRGRPHNGRDNTVRYVCVLVLGMLIGCLATVLHFKEQQLQARLSITIPGSVQLHQLPQPAEHSPQQQQQQQQSQPLQHPSSKTALTLPLHRSSGQAALAVGGRLYVATAANAAYFSGLTNLVGSLRYWCPECHVLVFNLGLNEDQLTRVRSWCNTTLLWPDGQAGQPHLKEAKKYAWKPIAILQAVDTYKNVLWLDAGSTVTTPLRTTVWPLLLKDGHFLVQGQDNDMVPWCHDLTWSYFGLDKTKFAKKPSFSGNTVGFVKDSPGYSKILKPWAECAKVEACMAPPGTSTGNHRFDQSVLSIIAYTADLRVTEHTELLLAEGVPCFKPHPRAVWTSRQGCSCYQKFAGTCEATAQELGSQSYLPPYPGQAGAGSSNIATA